MKALYRNRLCYAVEAAEDITLDDDGRQFAVDFSDPGLVVDPTDAQVADADNLSQWYGFDEEATSVFRAMLRGELSAAEWEARKPRRATSPA
jgi:hypothetical protein